ncbi:MAG: ATP-dependent Clp protease proteolytic subunit [Oscillospiraceae bacterium]|nr:ATP-dependent Clp protease proteolytic subunit [Oscillospiraceae bacterium]
MQSYHSGEYHPPEEFPGIGTNPNPDQDPAEEHSGTEQQLDESELIQDNGSIRPQNAKHLIHCLTVIGQVEGHYELSSQNKTTKYEHIIPALVAIEQDRSIEGLLILLNTVGGDVEAGLAIAELIAGMQTPTVSLVVGGGHSIGVPLSVSAMKSYIVPSASMTIHPVRMNGMMLGVPQSFSYISKIQDRIISFVTRNSKISEQQFRSLMTNTKELATDVGTVISGEQAVQMGLIDRMGSLSDAISELYELIETTPARYPD